MIRGPANFHDIPLSKTPLRVHNTPATDAEAILAMWRLGNNTMAIAVKLGLEEPAVYDALASRKRSVP